jgi:phosphopantetheinyl transferase
VALPSAKLFVSRFGRATDEWFEAGEAGLSAAERRRLPRASPQRLHLPEHRREGARRRHILSRRLMRFATAAELGGPKVRVEYPDNGPPRLAARSQRSESLSLSHCCETVAVVVADRPIVGCDILSLARTIRWQPIAAAFFSEDDYTWIMAAPDEARERFGSLWCMKEAVAKCSGAPLLRCLRDGVAASGKSKFWVQSGRVADCTFAVASDVPLAVEVRDVPIEAL